MKFKVNKSKKDKATRIYIDSVLQEEGASPKVRRFIVRDLMKQLGKDKTIKNFYKDNTGLFIIQRPIGYPLYYTYTIKLVETIIRCCGGTKRVIR